VVRTHVGGMRVLGTERIWGVGEIDGLEALTLQGSGSRLDIPGLQTGWPKSPIHTPHPPGGAGSSPRTETRAAAAPGGRDRRL
jgi:hypothetical protein